VVTSSPAPASAAEEVRPALVQTIATSGFIPPSPDPSGIVYVAAQDRLLISDSEVDEMALYLGFNLFTATRTGLGSGTGTTLAHANNEPAGLGFNPADGTLFESNDDADRVWLTKPGADGRYGTTDDTTSFFSTTTFVSSDPEGVEYDTATGHLFICDGSGLRVYEINPVNGTFGDGNDVVTSFGLSQHSASDCEGIGIDAQRNTLLAVDPSRRRIYELSKNGALLRTLVLDQTVIPTTGTNFASVTMAPSSDPNDSPSAMSYWLVDRHVDNGANPNENDGLLYELSLGAGPPPAAQPPPAEPSPTSPGTHGPPGTHGRLSVVGAPRLRGHRLRVTVECVTRAGCDGVLRFRIGHRAVRSRKLELADSQRRRIAVKLRARDRRRLRHGAILRLRFAGRTLYSGKIDRRPG
jgi:hypothetical protein